MAVLAPLRSRLLRGVQVATRRSILDLGAGHGALTGELVRRGAGRVVAVDAAEDFLTLDPAPFAGRMASQSGGPQSPDRP